MTRVVVVGGGVDRAHRRAPAARARPRARGDGAGGRPTGPAASSPTCEVAGLRLPAGADSFVARKPWAVDLCRELGLELVAPASSGAWLWTPARPRPVPVGHGVRDPGRPRDGVPLARALGPGPAPGAPRSAAPGKRKDAADETLGALLRRRLGDEATDRAVAPLLGGLYAGDVDRLSARATFPELVGVGARAGVADPRRAGRDAPRARRRPGADVPASGRGGVHALTDALAARLGDRVRDRGAASTAVRADARRRLADRGRRSGGGAGDAVVLAVPAAQARALLEPVARAAAEELARPPRRLDRRRRARLPRRDRRRAPGRDRVRGPARRGAVHRGDLALAQVARPRRTARARSCAVSSAPTASEDVLDAPDEDIVEACARHLSALLPLPEPRGIGASSAGRARCRSTSSATVDRVARHPAPPAAGYRRDRPALRWGRRRPTASAPRARRPAAVLDHLRSTPVTETDLRALPRLHGHAASCATAWPTPRIAPARRARSRTCTSRGTARSPSAAPTPRSGSAPTPT